MAQNNTYKLYRVAQNKPDYVLRLSNFCISTRKHVKYNNVSVASKTLVKAVSSTGCNDERQSFAHLSASSRFAGLLSGARRLECDDDSKQAVEVLRRSNGIKPGLFGLLCATL